MASAPQQLAVVQALAAGGAARRRGIAANAAGGVARCSS